MLIGRERQEKGPSVTPRRTWPSSMSCGGGLLRRSKAAAFRWGASVFNLSAGQISQSVKAATKMAGLGYGSSAHSPRVGMRRTSRPQGRNIPR